MAKSRQNDRAQKARGAAAFEEYYSSLYKERWPSLRAALLKESRPVAFDAGKKNYFLDRASILAALTLPLESAARILDMCAAPGGKSLVLCRRMNDGALLLANERSADRFSRLRRVLDEHLLPSVRERTEALCSDAAVLCKSKKIQGPFDAILLDAPCSSERHVMQDPKYLAQWSPARIKTLCVQQWAVLSSGYRLLKSGGYLLYSTCAINGSENEGIVKRLLNKFDDSAALSIEQCAAFQKEAAERISLLLGGIQLPHFEAREYGATVMPDAEDGAGPIYFCLIQKRA